MEREKTHRPRQCRLVLLLALLLIGFSVDCQAQGRHRNVPQKSPKVAIVDDEECGCELLFIDGIQTTRQNDLFGFKLEDGTVIVEPKYMFVDRFQDGFCIVYHNYDSCGLINREGREIVPAIYTEVTQPSNGMVRVKHNDLYGYYDTTGRKLIDFQYRAASGFNEGMAAILVDFDSNTCAYGYIDKSGALMLPAIYEYAFPFQEGHASVKRYDRYGMIDTAGNEVIPIKFAEVTSRTNGCSFVVDADNGKIAMYNSKFKQATPFCYDDVMAYSDGFFIVRRGDKYTFLNAKGKECFGLYDEVGKFQDGFAMVKRDGHYGIINNRGRIVLPIEYDNSGFHSSQYYFFDGLAMVEKEGKYGFVNTKGDIIIPIIYQSAHRCTEGLIPVKRNGVWGYIDTEGHDAIAFEFEEASYFEWGRAEVSYLGVTYKINPEGQCVKNCKSFPKIWHR